MILFWHQDAARIVLHQNEEPLSAYQKLIKVLFDILQFQQVSNTFSLFLCDAEDDRHGGQCEMYEQVVDIVDIKDKLVMFDVVDMDIIKTLLTRWTCENVIIVKIR